MSVEDLKRLFWDDPEMMWVGRKGNMVLELVKMLYFDYTLETEVSYMDKLVAHCSCFRSMVYRYRYSPTESLGNVFLPFTRFCLDPLASHCIASPW